MPVNNLKEVNQSGIETTEPQLRPYQHSAIEALRKSLSTGHKRPVLQLCTGGGKTYLSAEMIRRCESKGKRTLFICDSTELVEQALKSFDNYGLHVGVMQADHYRTDESKLTQVCTAQTLLKRIKRFRNEFEQYPVALIFIDEAHVQYAELRELLTTLYPHAPIIGLSATPFARAMGLFYDDVVSAVPLRQLINEGYLLPYDVYSPYVPDMAGVKVKGNDYDAEQAAKIYEGKIVADIVSTWQKLGENRSTLVFACNVAHSKSIAEAFVSAGVDCEHIDGYGNSDLERANRKDKIKRYKTGKLKMLVSVAILTKGFDAPITGCIVIARPTKSLIMHMQIHGRLIRTFDGMTKGIVLDHAGNFVRLGDPASITDFSLNDGTKTADASNKNRNEKDEPLPVPCSACHKLKPSGVFKCPHCGAEPKKEHRVVNIEGELRPLVQVEAEREAKRIKNKEFNSVEKQQFYSELVAYANQKNKSEKWILATYNGKFKEWPKGLQAKPADSVSPEVAGFIKHRNIAYARGRASA